MALLQVIPVLTLIHLAITPPEGPSAVHLVPLPLTGVFTTPRPSVVAHAVEVVVGELALVAGAVGPAEEPAAVLQAGLVLPAELGPVWPTFHTVSLLLIFYELPLVGGAVGVPVGASAVRPVLEPISIVHVTVGMLVSPLALGLVPHPLPDVASSVRPLRVSSSNVLDAMPVLHRPHPLARIGRAVLEGVLSVLPGQLTNVSGR
mmetsp:Transcript_96258/g.310583  ORF Transcript_96258/g.310583 Transcript_96258/m.310583 type:complete len:204 (-) Transcript_96258:151-762(-)